MIDPAVNKILPLDPMQYAAMEQVNSSIPDTQGDGRYIVPSLARHLSRCEMHQRPDGLFVPRDHLTTFPNPFSNPFAAAEATPHLARRTTYTVSPLTAPLVDANFPTPPPVSSVAASALPHMTTPVLSPFLEALARVVKTPAPVQRLIVTEDSEDDDIRSTAVDLLETPVPPQRSNVEKDDKDIDILATRTQSMHATDLVSVDPRLRPQADTFHGHVYHSSPIMPSFMPVAHQQYPKLHDFMRLVAGSRAGVLIPPGPSPLPT